MSTNRSRGPGRFKPNLIIYRKNIVYELLVHTETLEAVVGAVVSGKHHYESRVKAKRGDKKVGS